MENSLGEAFGCLWNILIIASIVIVGFGGYFIYDKVGSTVVESKTIVKPDYRLKTDGKKIDTIYVYTFK